MSYSSPPESNIYFRPGLSPLIQTSQIFSGNDSVKSVIRWSALFGIIAYLLYKLSAIGWGEIVGSLPSSPLFYALSITFVVVPIVAEFLVFRKITGGKPAPPFKLFVRKHVINEAVMSYAGEAYLVQKLSKLNGLDLRSAAIIIKNLALVRTFVANFWVILLVVIALILGKSEALQKIAQVSPGLVIAVTAVCLGVCFGGVLFFKKLTRLDFGLAGKLAAIYLTRSVIAACILVAQWSLVIPGTSLAVWFMFLIVFYISKKSPVGGDLVFVSVALTLPGLGGDSAAVAAMLVATAAIIQLIYSAGFALTSEFTGPKPARALIAPA